MMDSALQWRFSASRRWTAGRTWVLLGLAGWALSLCGCPSSQSPPPAAAARPFEGVSLRLLVVDDPDLADAARRFAGEWKAQSGASFEVVEGQASDLATAAGSADALIYPSCHLPGLAQQRAIEPVPREVLKDARLAWSDVFETLRLREATWASKTFGLPLGSPVLMCCYRVDLFEKFERRPPVTWAEYQQLAEFFADRSRLGEAAPASDVPWHGAVEPLADGWAGLTLLARAAAYAKHPDFYSSLFDMETFEPLIDGPPWVKALEELVAAAGPDAVQGPRLTPAEVRAAVGRGETALGLCWPSAANATAANKTLQPAESIRMAFCALPGASEVYNPGEKRWEDRSQPQRTPLATIAGRMGSVTSSSQHASAAFQLLIALTGRQWGNEIGPASPFTTLFRLEHLASARAWVEPSVDQAAARQYGSLVADALAGNDCLQALCLPGRERYLQALDEAVVKALARETPPADALRQCAERWRTITQDLGLERQLDVYRNSVINTP